MEWCRAGVWQDRVVSWLWWRLFGSLLGNGCLLLLREGALVHGETRGALQDHLYVRGPSAGPSLTVSHKHNCGLCTAGGSPAPPWEDGKGKVAEAANAKPLMPNSLPTSSSVALLAPLVQSGEKPPVHKPNRRDQAWRKREDPTDVPGSPQATPRSLAGSSK